MVTNIECLFGCLVVSGFICCCHTCEPSCAPSRSRASMPALNYGLIRSADQQVEDEEGEETEKEAVSGGSRGDEPDRDDNFDNNPPGPSAGIALNSFALMLQNIYYHYLPKGELSSAPSDSSSVAKATNSIKEELLPPSRLAMTR